jgi:hypothetical protein
MTSTPAFSAPIKKFSFRTFLVAAFVLFGFVAKAQGDMRFFGTATKDGSPLEGATVTVVMDDSKEIIHLTTGKNGKFKFTIDVDHTYRINYYAPGCVSMYMIMDLHTPPDKAWVYPDYAAEIPFFAANDPKVKTELFAKKPFIKVVFDGNKGFHDDPTYRFIDEIFKDPLEEQRKKDELVKKEADEKARLAAEQKAQQDELERQRLAREEEERRKQQEEMKDKNNPKTTTSADKPNTPEANQGMETDAIRLEREKQEKLDHQKQNQNIRAQYENNLLKLVAESERKNNLQKFNRMKGDAESNAVIQTLRKEAELKGQNNFLIEQMKERQRQTLANKQVKEEHLRQLIITAAQVEKTERASHLRPIAASQDLNYSPSPNIVVTTEDNFPINTKSTVISWPGGKRTIFSVDEYWWGSRYYYHDGVEIDEKTYDAELFKHKRG